MLQRQYVVQGLIFLIALTFHKSVILPVIAYVITCFYNNTKSYLGLWIFFLILSGFFHQYFDSLLGNLSFFQYDDRLSQYLSSTADDFDVTFSSTGFRRDFVAYSMIPIVLGYIYIYRYNFTERTYIHLYNVYVACNAFWLLLIRIPYSNRFAYLSWFIYPLVMAYPLLKKDMVNNQSRKIQIMVLLNYAFTYFMYYRTLN
ncbi:MAG: EpsG family protein [Tannerellaceae bacterium]|nr:EpsG family protein [Tannerellaceae bacterium]